MNRRPTKHVPDLTGPVMERLGYGAHSRRRWWCRDRSALPALICGVTGLVVVMVVLSVLEIGRDTSTGLLDAGDGRAVGKAIGETRSSFSQVNGAILRGLLLSQRERDLEESIPEAAEQEIPQSPSIVAPQGLFDTQKTWFGIEATSSHEDGYEGVVALAPGQST